MLKVVTQGNELNGYRIGDSDTRPWGSYKVIAVGRNDAGEEFCEKEITVNPGQILSLQSHDHRREQWTVREGILLVVLDDKRFELKAGETIHIPLHAIHCMANGHNEPCVVHEIQSGRCSEDDIIRYVDAYGRGTLDLDARSQASADMYNKVKQEISGAK